MTDGPFRNMRLGSCWKRLAEAVQNDAASPGECGAFASDALTRHLCTTEHVRALHELDAHIARNQLDLDPLGAIEAVFDRFERTPFLDTFKKEVLYRAGNGVPLADAIVPALDATIGVQAGQARSRFHEERIRATEAGELSRSAADRVRAKIDSAFDLVKCADVRAALLAGEKDAFTKDLGISDGVDDGMVRL